MVTTSTSVLAVADVVESVRFYVETLGFRQHWLWGEPPTFGAIGIGKVELFVCKQPELARRVEGHMQFFHVDGNIDELYAQHRAAGATIIEPIENKPWGVREYTVRDLSGYHLRFGGPPHYERPLTATESLPSHVSVSVDLPNLETYRDLFVSVGWTPHHDMAEALTRSDFGIVATDTRDGHAVGMLRVVGDGRNFTIWDVIVRPSHQGQKIGTAMVEVALAELRRRGAEPGVFIGLFGMKPGFYERLGFRGGSGMHRPL